MPDVLPHPSLPARGTTDLRRDLCEASAAFERLAGEAGSAAPDWMALVMASAYAGALAALLKVAENDHGSEVADALAAELRLILEDVDYGGDYNVDVWPAQSATPPAAGGAG